MEKTKTMCDQQNRILKLKNESGEERIHYPVVYEGFPEEFKQMAERELNETDENRKKGLQKLKDFMKRENITILQDYILLAILRNCKYNLKKSEKKLKNFASKRLELLKILMNLDTNKIESIIDDFGFGILPYRDKHGRAILYTRPYGVNLDKYEVHDLTVVAIAAILFVLKYPITTVAGFAYFGECKTPSFSIIIAAFRSLQSFIFTILSFPVRISRVEIFNENHVCHYFYKILASFISKKICSRVTLHGYGYDSLHQLYDLDILPEEFEGKMGPLSNKAYREQFLDFIRELKNEGP